MKLSLTVKIIIAVTVVLLCAGVAVYSFMRLNSAEQHRDFNLYTLVPEEAVAVFETDRLMEMLESVERMQCSKDGHFLHFSELFNCLWTFLDVWGEEAPHALSKQMNKVLLSFHGPGSSDNEVLYCALGPGDYERIEQFIGQNTRSVFPVKSSEYEGESIRIYPLNSGRFLAVYLTREFMALSFQKKLLEQVIDARRKKHSLMHTDMFKKLYADKQRNVGAMLYLRTHQVPMGGQSDSLRWNCAWGDWMEFDLKFTETAIYASGISYEEDTLSHTFVNVLRRQNNLSAPVGDELPASTFLYQCFSMTDKKSLLGFISQQGICSTEDSAYLVARDQELAEVLQEGTGDHLLSCFFHPDGWEEGKACAVVVVPLAQEERTRARFFSWLQNAPREPHAPRPPRFNPNYARYPRSQAYRKYLLPRHTLFTRLTGIDGTAGYTYACFYRGRLLLAADALSLSAYVDAMEKKDVLQKVPYYDEIVNTLASSYGCMLMADMDMLAKLSPAYQYAFPAFVGNHLDFFRHFKLAWQFTNLEGVIYPNVTLLYDAAEIDEQ